MSKNTQKSMEVLHSVPCVLLRLLSTLVATSPKGRRKEMRRRGNFFYGDSWFTSWHLCTAAKERFGHEYFGALKTNHSGTSKEEMG
jgi:hypothetical protein